jgi:hypothetical protein
MLKAAIELNKIDNPLKNKPACFTQISKYNHKAGRNFPTKVEWGKSVNVVCRPDDALKLFYL